MKTKQEIAKGIIANIRKGSYEDWIDTICAALTEFEIQLEQSHKHSVSGKRPTPELFCKVHSSLYGQVIDNIKQLTWHKLNGEELYELCLKFHQAACASGAVDKTVSEGNALQNFLKQEKEIEKRYGKIFDE